MYLGDIVTLDEAKNLLEVSITTLRKYRVDYQLSEYRIKNKLYLSKTEVLFKVYRNLFPVPKNISLSIFNNSNFDSLKIDEKTYDLRRVDNPDGHGAISLICHIISRINNDEYIHVLFNDRNVFLKKMNFFGVLTQHLNSSIFWDEAALNMVPDMASDFIKLPIRRVGVVGSLNSIADDLTLSLYSQGYSTDICAYIGWAIGELADNAATHAKVFPCYAYFEQLSGKNRKFLQFTIGDVGVGIPTSLKNNELYKSLEDNKALLTAFKPNVSGRSQEEKRGKGLTDVLKIAMECGSSLRVESNGIAYMMLFNSGVDNFIPINPIYKNTGTIISILFIDGNFDSLKREDIEIYIDSCLEKI